MSITKLYLLNVPLENDYVNTLYFGSKKEQSSYFLTKLIRQYDNFTYQRKESIIRIPDHYDNLMNCNYVMYQNSRYSDKWFYAFITDLKYINDNRTDITIETDVIQTWFFDYTVKQSFVEREHVNNDKVGLHTIPENLECGEYIINRLTRDDKLKPSSDIVMGSTSVPSGEGDWTGGVYNGLYSGVRYYRYSKTNLTSALEYLADAGKIDAITSLFLAPEFLIPSAGGGIVSESTS